MNGDLVKSVLAHVLMMLPIIASAYLLLSNVDVVPLYDYVVAGAAGIGVIAGVFLLYSPLREKYRITGISLFLLYICGAVGFGSAYHLAYANQPGDFRIDQELSMPDRSAARALAELERRLFYLGCIFNGYKAMAELPGGDEGNFELVEQAYKNGRDRTMLAIFGGLDQKIDDIAVEEIRADCLSLHPMWRPRTSNSGEPSSTPEKLEELSSFRSSIGTINQEGLFQRNAMADAIDRYWRKQQVQLERISFAKALASIAWMFDELDHRRQQARKLVYSRDTYLNMLYFSFVVGGTLGFGDIVPNSPITRLCVILQLIFSLFVVSIAINSLSKPHSVKR